MRPSVAASLAFSLCCALTTPSLGQGYAPAEAAGRMAVASGLEVKLFASEPMVRQPVAVEFDDRGRAWVIQYFQYPNPSGLDRREVDRFSRTKYDRTPEPPPRGPRGADRITILEDADGDGRADRSKDFVAGLNLASGLAFGRGGVFVLQAPYLLFYPDRDRDDRPDGDPEVLLTGFGMEDAHSVANSLTWGPDGWLYGLQGSTVTANIRGVEFQQGVWRYHPESRRFELFAEGGGNMWGLDFNRQGDLFASTNVGGFATLHAVQGGYYWKSFGKHGPLHNPHAYGYFDHVPHEGLKAGHVSVGGLFYEAEAFPPEWRGRYLSGDLLEHAARWHTISPSGSTFKARQGGDLLVAHDTWFAPSDMTLGPDGCLYLADWHDRRTAHPDPDAEWDRTNGRIYRIQPRGFRPGPPIDLDALPTAPLIDLLAHKNAWVSRRARRLLAERRDPAALTRLRDAINACGGPIPCLEALWTLAGSGGLDDASAREYLTHPDPEVRAWTVRLIGDREAISPDLASALVARAERDASVRVRAQLAGTAARLAPGAGLKVAATLLRRDRDRDDPHIPLRLWWAVERAAARDRDAVVSEFSGPDSWSSSITRETIRPRLIRVCASESTEGGGNACARLLASAPDDAERLRLVAALEVATRGRSSPVLGADLARVLREPWLKSSRDLAAVRLSLRFGDRTLPGWVAETIRDAKKPDAARLPLIDLVGEHPDRSSTDLLLGLATGNDPDSIRIPALRALSRFDSEAVAQGLLAAYAGQGEPWRHAAQELLLGRASWAGAFLQRVDRGSIEASRVPIDQVRRVSLLGDPKLDAIVARHWGKLSAATPEVKLAEVRRLNNDLRAGAGDIAKGRALFRENCASCHKLFDEGNAVGPDLTHANRGDRDYLLASLVDPSGVIRKEYRSSVIHTRDGRVLTGLVAEQTPRQVTLIRSADDRVTIDRAEIEAMADSPTSLMPEDLYRKFRPDALRDLFRYLESSPAAKP